MSTFTIAKGIRYLKVPKLDSEGNDLSTSLQELEKLRIKYWDNFGIRLISILAI